MMALLRWKRGTTPMLISTEFADKETLPRDLSPEFHVGQGGILHHPFARPFAVEWPHRR
jgi:hypothetical protein